MPADDARIELVTEAARAPMVAHLCRNALESGRDGDAYARPRPVADQPDPILLARDLTRVWATPVTQVGWERTFGLWIGDQVRGHLDLRGGNLGSELHRATLGIGVERPWRHAGLGYRLCDAAIAWARAHGLAYIDLGVFTDNAPAIALYRRLGFVDVGVTPDRFRVDGRSLDDQLMYLRL